MSYSGPSLPLYLRFSVKQHFTIYFLSSTFSCLSVITALIKSISLGGLDQTYYFGYNFCKNIAQHVVEHDIFDEMIQKLG